MCIICNTPDPVGDGYMWAVRNARIPMLKAERHLLEASRSAYTSEQRKAYNQAHKRMVKARKLWNSIESIREVTS